MFGRLRAARYVGRNINQICPVHWQVKVSSKYKRGTTIFLSTPVAKTERLQITAYWFADWVYMYID